MGSAPNAEAKLAEDQSSRLLLFGARRLGCWGHPPRVDAPNDRAAWPSPPSRMWRKLTLAGATSSATWSQSQYRGLNRGHRMEASQELAGSTLNARAVSTRSGCGSGRAQV